ncbi:unnamed protein product, partial [Owenia fusiformis]
MSTNGKYWMMPSEWQEEEILLDLYDRRAKLFSNPEYLEAYQKAREEGTREVYHTRVMIVGQYGVGKTSLKKRLLDEGSTREHNSTDGIQVDPSACYIDISNSVIWKTKAKGFTSKEDT